MIPNATAQTACTPQRRSKIWCVSGWGKDISSITQLSSVQFSCSVISDSLRPTDCSTPGLPVHHQLPEFTQTHVHQVGDAIQPSHPLSSLLLLPSIFPSIRVFSSESALHIRWPKHWSFRFSISPSNEYSGLISFRIDWFDLLVVQESSPTPNGNPLQCSCLENPMDREAWWATVHRVTQSLACSKCDLLQKWLPV